MNLSGSNNKNSLSADNISVHFGEGHTKVTALNKVSCHFQAGELTMVKGPSGSGKTTLISVLGGLQSASDGEVFVNNKALCSTDKNEVANYHRNYCGFVFQHVGLFPSLNAREQIMLPLQYLGFDKAECHRRADVMLEEVGLGNRKTLYPAQLSGGENQRVAIARMLAKEPRFIFADEPTSALDKDNGQIVARLLHNAAKKHHAIVICVTHDDRLSHHADRLLHIEDGVILNN